MELIQQKDFHVNLDLPVDGRVTTPYEQLWGWIFGRQPIVCLRFSALGVDLPFARVPCSDLDPVFYTGFSIYLDLPMMLVPDYEVSRKVIVTCFDKEIILCNFTIEIGELTNSDLSLQRENKIMKTHFIKKNCNVNVRSIIGCQAPCALPNDWDISPKLSEKKDPVSSHFYGPNVQYFLKSLDSNAVVLDAGAGFRKIPYKNVINLEIYDYPSTDILAVGDRLPFFDDVFDAVLSLAVLEHVRDPFACAREIRRVLKPGGKVLVMLPFLQAEHGYPSHYFNATRFGVRELFQNMKLEEQFLDPSNQPIFTLNQILGLYASGLSGATQDTFLALKISELLDRAPQDWLSDSIVSELRPEIAWLVAWGTTTVFSKR